MRAIIGMENGPIKIIEMELSKVQHMLRVGPEDVDKNGTMTTEAIAWVEPDKSFIAAINGSVFFCNIDTEEPALTKVSTYSTGANEECVYIGLYPGSQTDVITCTTLGDVVLHQGVCAEGTPIKIEPSSAKVICKANAPAQAVCVGVRKIPIKKEENNNNDNDNNDDNNNNNEKESNINNNDEKESKDKDNDEEFQDEPIIAVGGRKKNVVVYSLITGEKVWAVKKQKNDPRTRLSEPVWPTCVAFSKTRPNILVVGTGYNKVRAYDMTGVQRTAISDTLVTQRPLNCVTVFEKDKNPFGREFFGFGSTYGELMYVNPFGKKKVLGGFRGITGSIRSVCYNEDVLVVAGIDRFLRIFNFRARLPIKKMYIKQIPKCMIVTQEKWGTRSQRERDTDEIWNSLSDASARRRGEGGDGDNGAIVKDEEEENENENSEDEEEDDDDDDDDDHDDNVMDSESDEEEEEEEDEEVDDLTEGSDDDDDDEEEEEEEEEEIKAPIKKKQKKMN